MSQVQERFEVSEIYDDIERAYKQAPFNQSELSAEINPVSKRLYSIGQEIESARADRLDRQFFTNEDHKSKAVNLVRVVSRNILGREIIKPKQVPLIEATLKSWEMHIGPQVFQDDPDYEYIIEAFFNDDVNNWYCKRVSKSSISSANLPIEDTLHFEVLDQGVLKISSQPEVGNQFITGEELDNFLSATELYRDRIMSEIYQTQIQN